MEIHISKEDSTPVYRQIINFIESHVKIGKFKAGDRLPAERDLAEKLGVARGTIQKAFEELEFKKIIHVVQGRGSFIAGEPDANKSRKERAVKIISDALSDLETLNFTFKEIRNLIQVMIMEREQRLLEFNIAAIDCNPEALNVYEKQLLYATHKNIHTYLLQDLSTKEDLHTVFSSYNMILTTLNHYDELLSYIPEYAKKIFRVAVSPSQKTIMNLAGIWPEAKIGVVCESERFFKIVQTRIEAFNVDPDSLEFVFTDDEDGIRKYLEKKDIIIASLDSRLEEKRGFLSDINIFYSRGGKIIEFEYVIERGSLAYIEEEITSSIGE